MDNIIRSVDGDMAIVMPSLTDNNMQMTMAPILLVPLLEDFLKMQPQSVSA